MNQLQSYHYVENKDTDEWRDMVRKTICDYTSMKSLIAGKNEQMLSDYINGDINMKPFMKMFKSIKEEDIRKVEGLQDYSHNDKDFDKSNRMSQLFPPLPLMSMKFHAAANNLAEQDFEITCKAIDNLASEQRKRDIEYLKISPLIKQLKQGANDKMGFGDAEINGTKYSSYNMKEAPLGLDLSNSDDVKIFQEAIYKHGAESASESVLDFFWALKNGETNRYINTKDALKLGVMALRVYPSRTTGFFELENPALGSIFTPDSKYPDFRDVPFIKIEHKVTAIELMNLFAEQIEDEEKLKQIINGKDGYCEKNKIAKMQGQFGMNLTNQKIDLWEFQVIATDWVYFDNESGLIVNADGKLKKETSKKCFQNTYKFFWLKNTGYYLGAEKLGFAQRKKGNEIYSAFDILLYRSSEKSPAEHCIGANKIAQIAYIKLIHAIIKAAPKGKVIDMKGIVNAASSFIQEGDENSFRNKVIELYDLAVEDNIQVINTEGFDGANEGQFKPITEIAGGLNYSDISSYLAIIKEAEINISRWTGINDDIAGINNNAEMLNFARKSSIMQGLNSMKHIQRGIQNIYQKAFNIMFYCLQDAIRKNGVERKVIENIIGVEKTEVLENLESIGVHTFFLELNLGDRNVERQDNLVTRERLEAKGLVTALDKLVINSIKNPKEQARALAIIEKKAEKKKEEQEQRQMEFSQQMQESKNQSLLQVEQLYSQGRIQNTYAEGEVKGQLLQMAKDLKFSEQEQKALLSRLINKDRYDAKLQDTVLKNQHKEKMLQEQIQKPIQ